MRKALICMLVLQMLLSFVLVAYGGGDSSMENKPSERPGESTSQPESGKNLGGETKPSERPSENSTESPACAHEIVVDAGTEATCTTDGITEGKHCAKCEEILVAQEVIPSKGHDFVNGKCTRCGKETSKGLEYSLNADGASYSVTGIGSCKDTDVVIPSTHPDDGKPVTSIGDQAFHWCTGLTSVTIPDSVTSIGSYAFYGDELTSITIPDSVTSIGECAFYGCTRFTSVTIPDSVTSIGDYAFSKCLGLTSVTIGNGITSIGEYVFSWCEGLTSVIIPDSVTSIGYRAFWGCSELTSITIPDSVTSIGAYVFYKCLGLSSVTISNSITSIGYSAFQDCEKLVSITYQGTVEQWKAISEGDDWYNISANASSKSFTVYCADGEIKYE